VGDTIDDRRQQQLPDRQQTGRLSGRKTEKTRRTFDEAVKHTRLLTRYLRLQNIIPATLRHTLLHIILMVHYL